jgi:hypothetical protein
LSAKLGDIDKIVKQALESKQVLDAIGKSIAESIPKRTRLGRGVQENDGPAVPLKKLQPKTKTNRKLLKEKGELKSELTSPAKSNLTQTGQMLESIVHKVPTKGKLTIEFDNPEAREKAFNVQRNNKGFSFFKVSKAELNRALKEATNVITQILSKIKFDKL